MIRRRSHPREPDAVDPDGSSTNASGNRPFASVLARRLSRRDVLRGGLGAAAALFVPPAFAVAPPARIAFTPVTEDAARGRWPAIAAEYRWDVLLAWGDPLTPGGPGFVHPPDPDAQPAQFGIGHDGMWYFPVPDDHAPRGGWRDLDWDDALDWFANTERYEGGSERGLLALNHEFGRNRHVLGHKSPRDARDVRISQQAHGVSVAGVAHHDGRWQVAASRFTRRVDATTPVAFSGPAAGHALLATPAGTPARGTLNNCSSGYTPWGTYLSCEENFHTYFGVAGRHLEWQATPALRRYGFSPGGYGYGWHHHDPRFDLANHAHRNEENRFGWVVELDPFDPARPAVKRTALGRMKHEGVALVVGGEGRVVCYMGDDQASDYVYKFVSAEPWKSLRARGLSPLDHGQLYVARFNEDGTGDWLPLDVDDERLAGEFADQGEVLTFTRLAADHLGATPMDRPEWTTVAPNGEVYCSLTGNPRRLRPNAANPRAPNPDGHIIRWRDDEAHLGARFTWDVFLVAADTRGTDAAFSGPDGLWADPDGRLFIETDAAQRGGLNNQLLVADTRTGALRRLFTGVPGDELTGLAATPDRRTLFLNCQHPGNGDPRVTNFPAPRDGTTIPRDATLVITRTDGGIVGS